MNRTSYNINGITIRTKEATNTENEHAHVKMYKLYEGGLMMWCMSSEMRLRNVVYELRLPLLTQAVWYLRTSARVDEERAWGIESDHVYLHV